jgi:hypothetical protein
MTQTAVEWLAERYNTVTWLRNRDEVSEGMADEMRKDYLEQAKQMEKEQIMKTARQCHFEGVRQSAKNSEEYLQYGEEYYNETYGNNK